MGISFITLEEYEKLMGPDIIPGFITVLNKSLDREHKPVRKKKVQQPRFKSRVRFKFCSTCRKTTEWRNNRMTNELYCSKCGLIRKKDNELKPKW